MILRRSDVIFANLDRFEGEDYVRAYTDLNDVYDEPSVIYVAADFILGGLMILAFLTSTLLNPLTFFFNFRQTGRVKASRVLFMLLSFSDFLTNIYHPLQNGYRFVSPTVYPFVSEATAMQQFETHVFRIVKFSSLILTAFISILRFINVKYPFYNVSSKIIAVICCFCLVEGVIVSFNVTSGMQQPNLPQFFLFCQMVTNKLPLYKYKPFMVHNTFVCLVATAGVICSLLTVFTLMKKKEHVTNQDSSDALRKSSVVILVMNVGNVIMLVVQITYMYYGVMVPMVTVLGSFGLTIVLSALNPLIRICSSTEIKDFIVKLVSKRSRLVNIALETFNLT